MEVCGTPFRFLETPGQRPARGAGAGRAQPRDPRRARVLRGRGERARNGRDGAAACGASGESCRGRRAHDRRRARGRRRTGPLMTDTISRRVAVVGIGETAYYRHGQSPVPEFLLAIEAIEKAAADAGLDVRDDRRLLLLLRRAQRSDAARHRARPPRRRVLEHVLGRRWRRRLRRGRQRGGGARRRLLQVRRGLPLARAGTVRTVRSVPRSGDRLRDAAPTSRRSD